MRFTLFHKKILLSISLFILLLPGSRALLAQKNDTLYFLNDDRISGEIKQYKYGFLNYKTYGVSTVKVKYAKISTSESSNKVDYSFTTSFGYTF